jgi:hypothetical protein
MATTYGNQYNNAYVVKPSVKIPPGDYSGAVKRMYFDYTITAVSVAADILKLGKLPKGARVYDACLSFPDLGTTGTLELGWAASPELDATGTTLEAADADGFMASVDVNTAASTVNMADVTGTAVPGFLKDFAGEVDVQIYVTTAWTVTSGTIKGYIEYVID